MQNYEDLWNLILKDIKENRVAEVVYKLWMKDIVPVSFDGVNLVLKVDNIVAKDVIEKNYNTVIIDAFKELAGIDINLTVIEEEEEIVEVKEPGSEYTFDNFIIGASNRFAHAAARAVSEHKNIIYNPLVLYGNSGVGKTHLAMAIFNKVKKDFPDKKLLYIRAEEFGNEVIDGIKLGTMEQFRQKYRQVDLLLLDDIHFIAGKPSIQEEFFNTFNALHQNGKQIVVTSDRPPKDIKTLGDRILSRLEHGLLCDIAPPEFETRVAIIQNKAKELEIEIDSDIVFYIADQIKLNIRQLEGVVKKLEALVNLDGKVLNKSIVQSAINEVKVDTYQNPITAERIIEEIGRTYNVPTEDITSQKRGALISKARQLSMYVIKQTTDLTLTQIGEAFGRNHATVCYSLSEVENLLKSNLKDKEIIEDIIKNLQS